MKTIILAAAAAIGLSGCVGVGGYGSGISVGYGSGFFPTPAAVILSRPRRVRKRPVGARGGSN